jgi:hypothetical protein
LHVRVGAFTHVAVAIENAVELSAIDFALGGMSDGRSDGSVP